MQLSPSALLLLPLMLMPCDVASDDGDSRWKGVSCCREAVVPSCATVCKRATSEAHLEGHCRRSNEAELYNCLTEQKRSKNGRANHLVEDDEVQEVLKCCQGASPGPCRTACQELQRAGPEDREAVLTRLQDTACSQDVRFRSCQGSGPPAPSRPGHRLELLCCPRADTAQCRQLCARTYSLSWHDQGPRFETRCLDANFGETRMRQCIRDAEAPCLPSSARLHFCEGSTDGSSSLYRRWDQGADINAKNEFLGWMRTGALGLSFRNLSIVTTGRCKTELKRLACLLHLGPCRRSDHQPAQICRSDCVRLLETCLSPAGGGADPETLCGLISAPEPDCVRAMTDDTSPPGAENSVEFLSPRRLPQQRRHQVSSPCRPSLCGPGMVCRVAAPNQATYVCLPGCRLSTVSGRMVALGSPVLLPPVGGASDQLSLLLCAPGAEDGDSPRLERCAGLTAPRSMPCDAFDSKIDSGTVVHQSCLSCVCVDGDLLCRTAQECLKSGRSLVGADTEGPAVPRPSCVHITTQRCVSPPLDHDPCEVRPCPAGHHCLPHPDVCVDSLRPCELHTCVPGSAAALSAAAATCRRSQSSVVSVEESDWHQPYVACSVPAEQCDAPSCSAGGASCGSALRLYFSRRRLRALGSPVPARAVLSALRRLVATADCAPSGRLEAARQLTVTLSPAGGAAAAACRLEADKLRVWLSSGSPAASAEPALWPVVFVELVPEPADSGGGGAASRPLVMVVVVLLVTVRWCQ